MAILARNLPETQDGAAPEPGGSVWPPPQCGGSLSASLRLVSLGATLPGPKGVPEGLRASGPKGQPCEQGWVLVTCRVRQGLKALKEGDARPCHATHHLGAGIKAPAGRQEQSLLPLPNCGAGLKAGTGRYLEHS